MPERPKDFERGDPARTGVVASVSTDVHAVRRAEHADGRCRHDRAASAFADHVSQGVIRASRTPAPFAVVTSRSRSSQVTVGLSALTFGRTSLRRSLELSTDWQHDPRSRVPTSAYECVRESDRKLH